MARIGGLRPLSQLTAYGAATGGFVGGGVAVLLTTPLLIATAGFGIAFFTFPAFTFGEAVGVVTGALAPLLSRAALAVVHPHTLRGWRATVASAVVLAGALPTSVLLVIVALPLTAYRGYPLAPPIVIAASLLVAGVTAWRLAPEMGRAVWELSPNRRSRAGWWLVATGLVPVMPLVSVYAWAWFHINFTFDPGPVTTPVEPSLVLTLAILVTVCAAVLSAGVLITWPAEDWALGEFSMFWAYAGAFVAILSSIGFWRLVAESMT